MPKRKMILIVDVEETLNTEGIKYAVNQAFSSEQLVAVDAYDTSFYEDHPYSLSAFDLENDAQIVLENNSIEDPELVVKLAYEAAMSNEMSNAIGDAMDEVYARMKRERKI